MADEPISFEVNGVAYQARRMDLFVQIAIVTKLAPLMSAGIAQILQLFDAVASEAGAADGLPGEAKAAIAISRVLSLPKGALLERLGPLAAELAKMPTEDQRFVIQNVLSTVQVNRGDASRPQWSSIWPAGLNEAAFPEYRNDLFLVLRVVGTVLMSTLGPFTPGNR